jgi:hypothetical protein
MRIRRSPQSHRQLCRSSFAVVSGPFELAADDLAIPSDSTSLIAWSNYLRIWRSQWSIKWLGDANEICEHYTLSKKQSDWIKQGIYCYMNSPQDTSFEG